MNPSSPVRGSALSGWDIAVRCGGLLAVLLGSTALVGWSLHLDILARFSASWPSMRWNCAFGLIAAGSAVALLPNGWHRLAVLAGIAVLVVGLLTLGEYGTGQDFGMDTLLLHDPVNSAPALAGRMSPLSACCFCALGLSLLLGGLTQGPPWRLAVAGLSACAVTVITGLAVLGYIAGIRAAYGWGSYTQIALPTALGFVASGGALLAWAGRNAPREQINLARWLPITGSVTLMIMVACVSAASLAQLKESIYWRKHTYEVLIASQAMFSDLIDSQRGMRGYVLTGQSDALEIYARGLEELPRHLEELRALTHDNPAQQRRSERLTEDLTQVTSYSSRLIQARDREGLEAATALESTGEGRAVIDRTQADLDAFTGEEHQLLIEREARTQEDFRNATSLLVVGSALAAGLLLLAHLMASSEVNRRRRTEAKLAEVSLLQTAMLNAANYAIVSCDVRGKVTTLNTTAERWLGYRAAEVVGKATPMLWHDADEVAARAATLSRLSGTPVKPGLAVFTANTRPGHVDESEWTLKRKDGSRFSGSLTVAPLTDPRGQPVGFLGVLSDITERKQREAELRVSEERFRRAFDDAPIGMCLVSLEGRLLKVNRVLCTMFGYTESELLRFDFQTLTHPEDLQQDLVLLRKVAQGEIPSCQVEKRYLHRDGTPVYTNLSVSLVRDRDNAPLYFVSQIENITHRREMDRLKREFISTVSHELRTPLTSIRGSLGLVDAGVLGALPERVHAMVKIAHQNCERLVRIINDILDIEKIESGKLALQIDNVAVGPLLREALEVNAPYGEKYQVRFILESTPEDTQVRADPDRLMQVLANLLSNAAKFSPAGASVRVRAHHVGNRVRVEVQDSGTGIPEEFRARVFEKFAQADGSTARRFDGTGLGLSITRRLLESMGGTIDFTTETGRGTTFYFDLPACESDAHCQAPTIRMRIRELRPTMRPRILHVEDDGDLSQVIAAALAGRAEVVTASTLQTAEERLRAEEFSLVVLDVGLPDGNGLLLLDRLDRLSRSIPVVILSVSEVPLSVQQRVAAALVKSRLSEAEVVETILSLVAESSERADVRSLGRLA